VNQLIANVQQAGASLVHAVPHELVIGNIVRRVLGLIRDEAAEDRNADELNGEPTIADLQGASKASPPSETAPFQQSILPASSSFHKPRSVFSMYLGTPDVASSTGTGTPITGASTPLVLAQSTSVQAFRSEVVDGIGEILDEISQADDQIASFADTHIHPGDNVLVFQPSRTVEKFLTRAALKRRFTLFLSSPPPPPKSSTTTPYASLTKKLNALGVQVINVPDVGLYSIITKMSKVILHARAFAIDGSVVCEAGAETISRTARHQQKTVIVLGGVYKLCPENELDPEVCCTLGDPSQYVEYKDGAMLNVQVEIYETEILEPKNIDMYITNLYAASNQPMHP
jgi:translation initiation factor eIF-2B subunit beta